MAREEGKTFRPFRTNPKRLPRVFPATGVYRRSEGDDDLTFESFGVQNFVDLRRSVRLCQPRSQTRTVIFTRSTTVLPGPLLPSPHTGVWWGGSQRRSGLLTVPTTRPVLGVEGITVQSPDSGTLTHMEPRATNRTTSLERTTLGLS